MLFKKNETKSFKAQKHRESMQVKYVHIGLVTLKVFQVIYAVYWSSEKSQILHLSLLKVCGRFSD